MEKKEQVYQAALRLFNRYGFDKTPTSQIAKEAGVATGTLFHYFSTKEELINGLYLKCKESMIARMLCAVGAEKTYREKMKRIYLNLLQWGTECTGEFQFFQYFSNSPYIHELTRSQGRSKFDGLIELLREGMDREILRKAPADYLFTITSAFIMSNIQYFIQNKDALQDDGFVEESFRFIWNGIKS